MIPMEKEITREALRILTEKAGEKVEKNLVRKLSLPVNAGIITSVALSTFLGISAYERDSLEYARYDLDGKGRTGDNVRLLFLSDLHEKEFGKGNSRLLAMIYKADPDAVLIGGDMIVAGNKHPERYRSSATYHLCRELVKKYPVFYGEGNHEQRVPDGKFRKALEKLGVRYLTDETADWDYNISVTGINLEKEQYEPVKPKAPSGLRMKNVYRGLDKNRFNILLAHSPLFIESYSQTGADLVLAGHFHGGTVRLPGKVGLMTPQYQFFSTDVVGKKQFGQTFMIISAGLGTHSVNLRINNKPQVVVVDIQK